MSLTQIPLRAPTGHECHLHYPKYLSLSLSLPCALLIVVSLFRGDSPHEWMNECMWTYAHAAKDTRSRIRIRIHSLQTGLMCIALYWPVRRASKYSKKKKQNRKKTKIMRSDSGDTFNFAYREVAGVGHAANEAPVKQFW